MIKKVAKKGTPVKDLLFKKFKTSIGIKVFVLKYTGEKEKTLYSKVLFVLHQRNYLTYLVNNNNIQIFLTNLGRRTVDTQNHWEIDFDL